MQNFALSESWDWDTWKSTTMLQPHTAQIRSHQMSVTPYLADVLAKLPIWNLITPYHDVSRQLGLPLKEPNDVPKVSWKSVQEGRVQCHLPLSLTCSRLLLKVMFTPFLHQAPFKYQCFVQASKISKKNRVPRLVLMGDSTALWRWTNLTKVFPPKVPTEKCRKSQPRSPPQPRIWKSPSNGASMILEGTVPQTVKTGPKERQGSVGTKLAPWFSGRTVKFRILPMLSAPTIPTSQALTVVLWTAFAAGGASTFDAATNAERPAMHCLDSLNRYGIANCKSPWNSRCRVGKVKN